MRGANRFLQSLSAVAITVAPALGGGVNPWADSVVSFNPGVNPIPGYSTASVVLGSPERYTGEGGFPNVVSIFNPPYLPEEILSVGEGGSLVVQFDEPITNDPSHRFGVDLLIFGNTFFADFVPSDGLIDSGLPLYGDDPLEISVSADGVNFVSLGAFTQGLFPTQGYSDSGPYDGAPGAQLANFQRPVDPSLAISDFVGLTYDHALALYDGSGGGLPVDIAASGLNAVSFVRIDVPELMDAQFSIEIDAFASVPEPAPLASIGLIACAFRRKR